MSGIFKKEQGENIVAGLEDRGSRRPDNMRPFRIIVRIKNLIWVSWE